MSSVASAELNLPRPEETTMRRLSDAILSIYKASKSSTQTEFLAHAFQIIGEYVPYDRIHWRAGVVGDAGLTIYTLGAFTAPRVSERNPIDVSHVKGSESILLPRISCPPDESTHDRDEFDHLANTIAVWYRFGERADTPTVTSGLRFANLSFFVLSLQRDGPSSSFTDNDREIVQTLHDHISEAWGTNATDRLERFLHVQHEQEGAGAIVTASGIVLFADDRFVQHVATRWPRPVDAHLPDPLRLALIAGKTYFVENAHRYRIMRDGPIACICAHPRRAVDSLTARELQVAQHIALGLTHKEIARLLGISPSTVRKQIVSIHERMGVRNNAELAAQLGPGISP
ncbi:helix-turn-helix transcriptional regulator [Paraburkholderia sabiae]|uniref:Helix-turn-helix transcriptional regulator n=1 Tax=Paraburkholderia sabiae TaxID=273251 RepID=A0ABU9Q8U3_9BURK|nr:helix-turn-helix transcriptional regulator [Paraburkholderia sabiae]